MRPRFKVAIIVGAVAFVLNIIVAGALGICGPLVALAAGAIAGLFATQREQPTSQGDGARAGAAAGVVVGGFTLVGQIVGSLVVLVLLQFAGLQLPFGSTPPPGADAAVVAAYYLSGAGVATCLGVVGLMTAALGGAGGGYLGARPRTTTDAI
jgi:hypothetical protein